MAALVLGFFDGGSSSASCGGHHFCGLRVQSQGLLEVEVKPLEHELSSNPNQGKKEQQHKSSYIHVPTVSSLI